MAKHTENKLNTDKSECFFVSEVKQQSDIGSI